MNAVHQSESGSEPQKKKCVIVVGSKLHAQLKALADHQGRFLQKMVEEKLRELVEPAPLQIVEGK